jgi:hypothetical protein
MGNANPGGNFMILNLGKSHSIFHYMDIPWEPLGAQTILIFGVSRSLVASAASQIFHLAHMQPSRFAPSE